MSEIGPAALFLVGLLGGAHCIGMCGGIVGALSLGSAPRLSLHLAYNAGRIVSYAAAGALAGAFGQAGLALGAADAGTAWSSMLPSDAGAPSVAALDSPSLPMPVLPVLDASTWLGDRDRNGGVRRLGMK